VGCPEKQVFFKHAETWDIYVFHLKVGAPFFCSGGIIGLGEAEEDRVGLLHTLATLPTHPESVPVNALVAVKGTPLEDQKVFWTVHFFSLYACSKFVWADVSAIKMNVALSLLHNVNCSVQYSFFEIIQDDSFLVLTNIYISL
jgi:hypothetical protein